MFKLLATAMIASTILAAPAIAAKRARRVIGISLWFTDRASQPIAVLGSMRATLYAMTTA